MFYEPPFTSAEFTVLPLSTGRGGEELSLQWWGPRLWWMAVRLSSSPTDRAEHGLCITDTGRDTGPGRQ